jgi:hypothetical protein
MSVLARVKSAAKAEMERLSKGIRDRVVFKE